MSNPESTRYEIDKNADVAIREMYQPNKSFVHITPCTVDEDEHVVDYINTHHMYSNYTPITEEDNEELKDSLDNSEGVWFPITDRTTEMDLENIKELSLKEYNYEKMNDRISDINVDSNKKYILND